MRDHATTIFFHKDAYSTGGQKLMGRNAAGESFLRGFLKYGQNCRNYWVQVHEANEARPFIDLAKSYGVSQPINIVGYHDIAKNQLPGTVYYPGPDIAEQARYRSLHGSALYSICGITHTTSSQRAMDAIARLITEPIQPWDSIICTSTAVKTNVERILTAQIDEYEERLGISKVTLPSLPVIPLGIHTEDFDFSEVDRVKARASFGISEDTIVFLYAGRLSFHAKANPFAMYVALERAAESTQKRITLIESGWFANESIKSAFGEAGSLLCPSVERIFVDGRTKDSRMNAWAAADIFCSLSDNIQETFGIVPLEAMAAGLPQVVSDWNGYKDTVREGIDGIRIPTISPRPGLAGDLSYRHATGMDSYDMYCGNNSSLVALDEDKLTNAFVELIKSKSLRKRMGLSGKERARAHFDWASIIPRYEELWDEMAKIRAEYLNDSRDSRAKNRGRTTWPSRLDPTESFANYPTKCLDEKTLVAIPCNDSKSIYEKYKLYNSLRIVNYTHVTVPTEAEVQKIIEYLASSYPDPVQAGQVIANIEEKRRPFVLRALVWMLKIGLIKIL